MVTKTNLINLDWKQTVLIIFMTFIFNCSVHSRRGVNAKIFLIVNTFSVVRQKIYQF